MNSTQARKIVKAKYPLAGNQVKQQNGKKYARIVDVAKRPSVALTGWIEGLGEAWIVAAASLQTHELPWKDRADIVLKEFVQAVDATGGVVLLASGLTGLAMDEDWIDMGSVYEDACRLLGRKPLYKHDD